MYSADARVMSIRVWRQTRSYRRASALLGIGKSTIHRWVSNSVFRRRANAMRKMTEEALHQIVSTFQSNPFKTPSEVASKIYKSLNISLSGSCVRFWMKRSRITRKKAGRVVNKEGLDVVRTQFKNQVCDPSQVVSIDESSLYFDMKPLFGYCHSSRRLRTTATPGGRARWSLVMAVASNRVVGWKLIKGSVKGVDFAAFIRDLQTEGRDTLLLDNASIHKSKCVRDVMQLKNYRPMFLPPYTPEFQPIEHCFCVLKTGYKRLEPSRIIPPDSDVEHRITQCIHQMTQTALGNMFDKCWARIHEFGLEE